MSIYDEMQVVATELLTEFNQGVIEYIEVEEVPPVNPWDASTWEAVPTTLQGAVAKGVSQKYITDLVTAADIQITASVFSKTPAMEGKITIDGSERQIIGIKQIPAAGTPVVWKIFVKG